MKRKTINKTRTTQKAMGVVIASSIALSSFLFQQPQQAFAALEMEHSIINAGSGHSFAFKADGSMVTWGYNANGQLGDGTTTWSLSPKPFTALSNVQELDGGNSYSMALLKDGTVWSWGNNNYAQLGNGKKENVNELVPKRIQGLTNVVQIEAGVAHSAALKADGTVWTWGTNISGNLGNGTLNDSYVPIQVTGLTNVKGISMGNNLSVAVKADGTVWQWGNNVQSNSTYNKMVPNQIPGLTDVKTVQAGEGFIAALKNDGTVWAWGDYSSGQTGQGTSAPSSPAPQKDALQVKNLTNVKQLEVGRSTAIALKEDGTVWSWGNNYFGDIGDGTTTNRSLPVQVKGVGGSGYLTGISYIAYDSNTAFAVKTDGTVYAWGTGGSGQLGIGSQVTAQKTPVVMTGLKVESDADVTPPTPPTISASTTAPTKNDVVLTITYPSDATTKQYKIGSAGAWTSYTNPITVSSNGTIYARAIDAAGNTSNESSYTVSNIDKTAPAQATFSSNPSGLTNGSVTVTISYPADSTTKEYKIGASGSWTPYSSPVSISTNDTVFARSSDAAGNVSVESSFVVSNIDKIAPTPPTATVTGNQLTIQPGTDASGISKTEYQLNSGVWTNYASVVTLQAGSYVINARSVDKAGNVSEVTTINATVSDDKLSEATKAVEAAEKKPSQSLVDSARTLVNALPSSTDKTSLQNRLDVVQRYIDLYNTIQTEINYYNAEIDKGSITQAYIDAVRPLMYERKTAVNTELPSTMDRANLVRQIDEIIARLNLVETVLKTKGNGGFENVDLGDLQDQIDKLPDGSLKDQLQNDLNQAKALQEATKKVVTAEQSKKQSDVDLARDVVSKLPNGQAKDDLMNRLDQVQKQIDDAKKLAEQIADARVKVDKAEQSQLQEDVDVARDAVNKLPNGSTKDSLNKRLDEIQKQIDEVNANPVEKAVKKAEASKTQLDVDSARDLVNSLPDGAEKNAYHARLDEVDAALKAALSKTRQAELYKRDPYYTDAVALVNGLKESPAKTALKARLDAVLKQAEEDAFQDLLAKATAKVKQAEQYKRDPYLADAWTLVNALREGSEKQGLVDRLKAIAKQNEEDAYQNQLALATQKVVQAEQYKKDPYLSDARTLVNALRDGADKQGLEDRLNAVVKQIEEAAYQDLLSRATEKVKQAEKYKKEPYITDAWDLVNQLRNGAEKDALVDRLKAAEKTPGSIEEQIAQIQDPVIKQAFLSFYNALTNAEKFMSKTTILNAMSKQTAIAENIRTNPLYAEIFGALDARLTAVKEKFNGGSQPSADQLASATKSVEFYEKYKSSYYKKKAQEAVTALPDGLDKEALQARIDAV